MLHHLKPPLLKGIDELTVVYSKFDPKCRLRAIAVKYEVVDIARWILLEVHYWPFAGPTRLPPVGPEPSAKETIGTATRMSKTIEARFNASVNTGTSRCRLAR